MPEKPTIVLSDVSSATVFMLFYLEGSWMTHLGMMASSTWTKVVDVLEEDLCQRELAPLRHFHTIVFVPFILLLNGIVLGFTSQWRRKTMDAPFTTITCREIFPNSHFQ
jgi:hypothetical protein